MERLKSSCSAASDTPEIQRVKNNQRNISAVRHTHTHTHTDHAVHHMTVYWTRVCVCCVQYRESVGSGTAVTDTPEMERVRRNQRNISDAKYKKAVDPVSVGVTPELERVKQNQQNISTVQYQRSLQEVKGRSCSELDTPEMRRVRKSQDTVSMVAGLRQRLCVTSQH
uniref:Uncharacterized protein n=1 Tax=Sinocyclocheilus rhinocerous TaxID=307959 RepID=A0A673MR87_9TELE